MFFSVKDSERCRQDLLQDRPTFRTLWLRFAKLYTRLFLFRSVDVLVSSYHFLQKQSTAPTTAPPITIKEVTTPIMTYVMVPSAALSFPASCTLSSPVEVVLVLESIECMVVTSEPGANDGVFVSVLIDEEVVALLCFVNNVLAAEDGLVIECAAGRVVFSGNAAVVLFLSTFGLVAVVGLTAVLAQRKKRHWNVVIVLFFLTVGVLGIVGLTAVIRQKERK